MFKNFKPLFTSLFNSKYKVDLVYNLISFAIAALVGLLLNIIIIRVYGSIGLGYFNQVYAFYIFISQIAAWGIHLSVQKHIPQFSASKKHVSDLMFSSIVVSLIFSLVISLILLIFNRVPGYIVNSDNVKNGFIYIIPSLVFFSINKVLFSFFNGMRLMKTYAFLSSLRYICMLLTIIVLIWLKVKVIYVVLLFVFPEIIVFIFSIFFLLPRVTFQLNSRIKKLTAIHLSFGTKAAPGHIVLGSKPDIIILGIFLPDSLVGIYSFASTIIDGLIQIFYVFRTNLNPIITETFFSKGPQMLRQLVLKNTKIHYKLFSIIGILCILVYPIALTIFHIHEEYYLNIIVFTILTIGCTISSGYIPFQLIFNQTGFPEIQTIFLVSSFGFNILTNLIFIYFWGLLGAALATALAYIFQLFLLKYLVYRKLHIVI